MKFVEIAMKMLSPVALDGLVEEFVTRDGTDYGVRERTLEEKKAVIICQLERGEVVIVFDPDSETCNIITKDQLHSAGLPTTRLSATRK